MSSSLWPQRQSQVHMGALAVLLLLATTPWMPTGGDFNTMYSAANPWQQQQQHQHQQAEEEEAEQRRWTATVWHPSHGNWHQLEHRKSKRTKRHPSILAAEGFSHQSLLSQDIHRSLLPRDPVNSPCSGRTSIDPCCRGIQSAVLALAGHPSILDAAGSSQQSLLWQDIHRSLLPRDQVSSPCSGRTSIDPCCRGIKSTDIVLAGYSAIFAAAGSSQQSLLWQDSHQSSSPQDQNP
ncbi:hypothetical protein ACLKA6_018680 [Drosophila palustris]